MYTVKLPKSGKTDKFALDRALSVLKAKCKFDGLFEEIKRHRRFMTKAEKVKRKQRNRYFEEF